MLAERCSTIEAGSIDMLIDMLIVLASRVEAGIVRVGQVEDGSIEEPVSIEPGRFAARSRQQGPFCRQGHAFRGLPKRFCRQGHAFRGLP